MHMKIKNGTVTIDGREFSGSSFSIAGDGSVVVDGVCQHDKVVGTVNITVNGDVETLSNTSGTVHASDVGVLKTTSGDINCGDVGGDISTTSGDVTCHKIGGSVKTTSGDINKAFN